MSDRERSERRETILLVLGCIVVLAEVVMVGVQSAFPSHPVPTEFHAVVLVVATALFGGAALTARKNGGGGA